MQNSTRRDFLKKTSTAAVAGAAALAAPAIARSRHRANDRIRVAVIGVGGRGDCHWTSLLEIAKEGGNVEVAAICDCDEGRMKGSADMVEKASGHRPATPFDQRQILDDPSIDAVSLATPNHWHALETIWACQAGKDVYVEKPASHNIFEGRKMVEAARKYDAHRPVRHAMPLQRENPRGRAEAQGGRHRAGLLGPRGDLQDSRRRPEQDRARAQGNALGLLAGPRARGRLQPVAGRPLAIHERLWQRRDR